MLCAFLPRRQSPDHNGEDPPPSPQRFFTTEQPRKGGNPNTRVLHLSVFNMRDSVQKSALVWHWPKHATLMFGLRSISSEDKKQN